MIDVNQQCRMVLRHRFSAILHWRGCNELIISLPGVIAHQARDFLPFVTKGLEVGLTPEGVSLRFTQQLVQLLIPRLVKSGQLAPKTTVKFGKEFLNSKKTTSNQTQIWI